MTKLITGKIYKSKELGRKGHGVYLVHECINCGNQHLVQVLKDGSPSSSCCKRCRYHGNKQFVRKHSLGYILIYRPWHPYCNKHGYVPEHRLIIEDIIGRYINPKLEEVHHKDWSENNNIPNNLILITHEIHRRIHKGWQLINGEWWKTCRGCGIFMPVIGNFYKRKTQQKNYVTKCKGCCGNAN